MLPLALAVALVLITASTTVSVMAQNPTTTPTPMPATAIPPAVIGNGSTKIDLWDGLTGSDGATLDSMLTEYAKENPDVSITDEEMGWNDLYAKLTASFVAGTPPDMFIFHAAEIPQYASQGLLKATDDMFDDKGGPLPAKDFAQPAFDLTKWNGTRYG